VQRSRNAALLRDPFPTRRSDPLTALIVASVFIAGVVVMHILSKFTR